METNSIYENCEQFTAFPDENDVFYSDYEKEVMLPLGIMHVDIDGLKHDVLLAVPTISDDEGFIGCENIGERCGTLWLTYSKVEGKWALDCLPDETRELDQAPPEVRLKYQERKELFKKLHYIPSPHSGDRFSLFRLGDELTTHSNLYVFVGGYISHTLQDIPGEENRDEKLVTFESDDGGEYILLGRASGGVYSCLLGKFVFFFNSVISRVLVVVEYD